MTLASHEPVTVRIDADECPYCQTRLDAATGTTSPSPGDIVVCLHCALVVFLDEHMRLRKPYVGEIDTLTVQHPDLGRDIRKAQKMIKALQRRH